MSLDPNYEALIDVFRRKYVAMQEYARDVLPDGVEVGTPWKVHILVCHLGQWLAQHPQGLGIYCEQTCEATHDDFRKTYKHFKVAEAHPDHSARLLRSAIEYSSRRL